ncbi:MAG: hypothetical protein Q8M16_21650 [Pirellulaceae bacterium]|nr:hypothetical protein [Pirellulaceae bacterium]
MAFSISTWQEAQSPGEHEAPPSARSPTAIFHVPGFEREMGLLEQMHVRHQATAFSDCSLWDRWLPHASLWTGSEATKKYRRSLLTRRIDSEGYVAMQQHRGMAHSDGWPFPAWQQSTGVGFHFSLKHDHWAVHHFRAPAITDLEDWTIDGAEVVGIDPQQGLRLKLTAPKLTITTPEFRCGTIVAPFVRVEWATPDWPTTARATLRWQFENESEWKNERYMEFAPERRDGEMSYANIPTYRHTDYAGMLARYQLEFQATVGSEISLKSLLTAIDSRHPITNSNYLRACVESFHWTQDLEFLRANLPRMRTAANYMIEEFGLRAHSHVIVPWVGHDGRSGIVYDTNGAKSIRPGLGVGNNYWDLLPFGGHDALATIYAYDALGLFANLEEAVAQHPEWLVQNVNSNAAEPPIQVAASISAAELRDLAAKIRDDFQQRFWNEENGRFIGWEDLSGQRYDYGFTFVNLEAIHYGLASPLQAERIFTWLDGTRLVAGDTSQGDDIYHWRFAPRATTRRNIDTYVWAWLSPESIEWGGQVQDGGAVLGFSYFDLMARLRTQGPDRAWERLRTIIEWYAEVEAEGGYRTYYGRPGRGTLQGGGTAGGLGLDHEFFESVLVPQVMLYGFLGFEPTATGYRVNPRLPKDWPSLTISNIHHGQKILTITAHTDGTYEVVEK